MSTRKVVHNLSTGRMEVLEMKPEEITKMEADRETERQAREAEAQKPTPAKTLLAAAESAKTVAELRAVLVDLIKLNFGLLPEPEADDGIRITPQTEA